MDELEKLKKLLHHWKEHSDEHAEIYKQWAEKVVSLGQKDLSNMLNQLYLETKRLNELFEETIKKAEGD